MKGYNLDIAALQEIRWSGQGECIIEGDSIFYQGREDSIHRSGVGFFISRRARKSVLEFIGVNERIAVIRLQSKHFNISIISAYAPTLAAEDEIKDAFYDQLQSTLDKLSKRDLILLMGDMNAKVGKEIDAYSPAIGKHSLHDMSNENGIRLISFANANEMVISGTTFPHKDIHKGTWTSPGNLYVNQIDHILTKTRYRKYIQDVRVQRGADIDSDHYMVAVWMKAKLRHNKIKNTPHNIKYNLDKLISEKFRKEFQIEQENRYNTLNNLVDSDEGNTIDIMWKNIADATTMAAKVILGCKEKDKKDPWFDDECKEAVQDKSRARSIWIENRNNITTERNFKRHRKQVKTLLRSKKNTAINRELKQIEDEMDIGNTRKAYGNLRILRAGFRPTLSMIKSNGTTITDNSSIIKCWQEYFNIMLNRPNPQHPLSGEFYCEPNNADIELPTMDEMNKQIYRLKRGKTAGADNIPSELWKSCGDQMRVQLYNLIAKIWSEETTPNDWKKAIIIPIFKKGSRLCCQNYRGISLLLTAYKILAGIINDRVTAYSEENNIIGTYQAGFRKGKSTTNQIFTVQQLIEKSIEYNVEHWQFFIDFKQAYDSIHRDSLWLIMKQFGFPNKLIRLTKMCVEGSEGRVRIGKLETVDFEIKNGLRQGCVLSPMLFNLTLEKVVREVTNSTNKGVMMLTEGNERNIQLLAYADDVVIFGKSAQEIERTCQPFIETAHKIGLLINQSKTKIMKVSKNSDNSNNNIHKICNMDIEKVSEFKYLGTTLHCSNNTTIELQKRFQAANKCFYALKKFLKSKNISRKTKIRIYKTIIRPIATYGCETWPLTKVMEHKLQIFENSVLRRISGPFYDAEENRWKRRSNQELLGYISQPITSYVKKSRARWAGHVMRAHSSEPAQIALVGDVAGGKRKRGRPKKRWKDCFEESLVEMNLEGTWKEECQDRDQWRQKIEAAWGLMAREPD